MLNVQVGNAANAIYITCMLTLDDDNSSLILDHFLWRGFSHSVPLAFVTLRLRCMGYLFINKYEKINMHSHDAEFAKMSFAKHI